MHERLKELCEQAKQHADTCTKGFTGNEPLVWMDFYTEKLSELIIKECLQISADIENVAMRNNEVKVASVAVLTQVLIKERFGIKDE